MDLKEGGAVLDPVLEREAVDVVPPVVADVDLL